MHPRPLAVFPDAVRHVEGFRDDARIVAEHLGQTVRDQVGLRGMAAWIGRMVRHRHHRVDAVVHQVGARAVELVLVVRGKRQTRVLQQHHQPDQADRRAGGILEDREEVRDDVVDLGQDLGLAARPLLVVLHVQDDVELGPQRVAVVGGGRNVGVAGRDDRVERAVQQLHVGLVAHHPRNVERGERVLLQTALTRDLGLCLRFRLRLRLGFRLCLRLRLGHAPSPCPETPPSYPTSPTSRRPVSIRLIVVE
jgi:hypothetical protein